MLLQAAFWTRDAVYTRCMQCTTIDSWLSLDHTFSSASKFAVNCFFRTRVGSNDSRGISVNCMIVYLLSGHDTLYSPLICALVTLLSMHVHRLCTNAGRYRIVLQHTSVYHNKIIMVLLNFLIILYYIHTVCSKLFPQSRKHRVQQMW